MYPRGVLLSVPMGRFGSWGSLWYGGLVSDFLLSLLFTILSYWSEAIRASCLLGALDDVGLKGILVLVSVLFGFLRVVLLCFWTTCCLNRGLRSILLWASWSNFIPYWPKVISFGFSLLVFASGWHELPRRITYFASGWHEPSRRITYFSSGSFLI